MRLWLKASGANRDSQAVLRGRNKWLDSGKALQAMLTYELGSIDGSGLHDISPTFNLSKRVVLESSRPLAL